MLCLIYLALQNGPVINQEDLERLDTLRAHAKAQGYAISQVWPVYEGVTPEPFTGWLKARQALIGRDFDAVIMWHQDKGVPDVITLDDLVLTRAEEAEAAGL